MVEVCPRRYRYFLKKTKQSKSAAVSSQQQALTPRAVRQRITLFLIYDLVDRQIQIRRMASRGERHAKQESATGVRGGGVRGGHRVVCPRPAADPRQGPRL